jgi:chemotaxis methyl-accepting protein methylase
MPYTYTLPKSTSFTGTGLEGYSFGPLRQQDLDVYYIESHKGHDTFMVSKKITRTYYVVSGSGYFTIDNGRYDVGPGMLVEVPPKVEYTYSGKMTLIGFARPRWFSGNDTHTRWNPDVTCRDSRFLPGREPWLTQLMRLRIAGKSPAGAFLRLNQWLWYHLPESLGRLGPVRSYGNLVHALARRQSVRAQAFSTYFLRNRPELELIRRQLEMKSSGETLRVAVLGCSFGAEAYSIAWTIHSACPDLKLILNAVDISGRAVEFAKQGVYSLTNPEPAGTHIFERMTSAEKEEFFEDDGGSAAIKPWIKEGIRWSVADAGEPDLVDALGPQDVVVANNFLCHMPAGEAERCLRNIARLVGPNGHLFVSGIDLDVRTKVAEDLRWKPVEELLEAIHEGDPCLRVHWPWHYGGLEPLDKKRPDWRIRYAAAFQIVPVSGAAPVRHEGEPAEHAPVVHVG